MTPRAGRRAGSAAAKRSAIRRCGARAFTPSRLKDWTGKPLASRCIASDTRRQAGALPDPMRHGQRGEHNGHVGFNRVAV